MKTNEAEVNGQMMETVAYTSDNGRSMSALYYDIQWNVIESSGNTGQPFKFGGKELISANGLMEYDFGARRHFPAVPQFTSIDPLCEKYYHLSPYLYCGNDPVNFIDRDGKDVTLWTTKLPGFHVPYATHTFLTVTDKDGNLHHFAYGSEFDGIKGATRGRLELSHYEQDLNIIAGNDMESVKAVIQIPLPDGMTQAQFDEKVIDIANDFGNNPGISYHFNPKEETQGNCNTSTYTILYKAGVSEEILDQVKESIPGLSWGFGDIRPWTKEEQHKAVEKANSSAINNLEKWISDKLDDLNSLK